MFAEVVLDIEQGATYVSLDAQLLAGFQVGRTVRVAIAIGWVDAVEGSAWIIIVLIIEYHAYRSIIVSPPLGRVSESQGILAVQSATCLVLDEAVAGIIVESKAVGKFVLDDWGVDETCYLALVVAAVVHGEFALEFVYGFVADDVDAANLCTSSKEGSLRTLYYFQSLQVEKFYGRRAASGCRNAIHKHGNSWLGISLAAIRSHTTDYVAGVVRALQLNLNARGKLSHVVHLMKVEFLHHATGYGTYSHRNLQAALLLLLGSNDYLAQGLCVFLHHHLQVVVVSILGDGVVTYISKGELVAIVHVYVELAVQVSLYIRVAAANHHARQSFALFVGHLTAYGIHAQCFRISFVTLWSVVCFRLQTCGALHEQGSHQYNL